ncbi:EamA family transporter [Flavobacterium degerlachei]|jgi:drug/metabolite transporter (DMT)-like permease|uniref:EamA-like transporter family protein n=1 Tax=Flavobacterium degerlachei TaxID=229203 RepID=A0A1H2SCN5_9FLAO|nr:EamA family transporter [Flavobacterium degerlachei]SDW28739.1 EamA-like transporter family protein [Flavobacterium degerlachei]
MLFLILSIICSVTVGVIFKVGRKYTLSTTQIVAWNYVFALLLCYFFYSPDLSAIDASAPWSIYIPLGILLPAIFLFLAASIKHMGIVKTDAAQRLSLFIPIVAAWLLFDEEFNSIKLLAFLIALPALLLILSKKTDNLNNKWVYPAVVLVGFGTIDILFKQIALTTSLPFTTSLFIVFGISFGIILAVVLYEIAIKKAQFKSNNLLFGALVGVFNFGNILFYLKAHQAFAKNPSTVFAAMNMGVIIIGSIVGVVIFKEKVSRYNYFGLLLAIVAIVLITFSQVIT